MKKSVVFLLLVCMAVFLSSAVAMAGPAPALTKVDIHAFTAQSCNYQWQFTPANYPRSMHDYSFSGPELYMSVIYTGIPNWNLTFIKVNGTQYKHSQLFEKQFFITDSGRMVGGYEIVYKIPSTYLGVSNTIIVTSRGTNGGSGDNVATNIKFVK
ncbi:MULTISPECIES: hypothetical protein [Sporomusa]|uniref:Chagasin family peptidase inhibitor I42 n=2 Tax=Sporomusa TaxID=2375 RepID=A0ABP2CFD2_9FIRM|nr:MULTISPECIES: hypothetical protein [Sporomusa]MCM0760425.1 hypothetical protein [Sporomusa sphaeroides DSM 2875]OLS54694.1 hypothetical protein SPSPH_40270 [Sporomusa sphaeroides DSM 2875]CVK20918.1 hypothetical protein SSPH_03590 [Sporomusa sphaeroides DSM 2875]SCM82870.1 conserved exported hypothetical protein [uncultured Sporomusa sp.]